MRKPIQLSPLSPAQIDELHALYRTTKDVRLRTRAQIILLTAEQGNECAHDCALSYAKTTKRSATGSNAIVPKVLRGL